MKTVADPEILRTLGHRLGAVTADSSRVWGTMSAQQMLLHLGDAAEAALGRRAFAPSPRPPSRVMKWAALQLPLPWPRNIRGASDPAVRNVNVGCFGADRERALATLDELATATGSSLAERHPVFGLMREGEWKRWAFLHTDHHLRQFGS